MWFNKLEQKFPVTGKIGKTGERNVRLLFKNAGHDVVSHPRSIKFQTKGNDIEIDGVSVDVKTNVSKSNSFAVEVDKKGWLFNFKKKSPYIIHYSRFNDKMAVYLREDMQDYIKTNYNNLRIVKDKQGNLLTWFSFNALPKFVTILN